MSPCSVHEAVGHHFQRHAQVRTGIQIAIDRPAIAQDNQLTRAAGILQLKGLSLAILDFRQATETKRQVI